MLKFLRAGAIAGLAIAAAVVPVAGATAATPSAGTKVVAAGQSTAQVDSYWTPERIASAKPYVAPEAQVNARTSTQRAQGEPVRIPGTRPGSGQAGVQASVWGTIGRLYFSIGNGNYICSANVVASDNGDTIATARHCGFNDGGQNYSFAPGYDRGNAPHGWWSWRLAVVVLGDGDTAFVVLNTQNGRHVQNVVGSSGVAFNHNPTSDYTYLLGLPGDKDYAVWCHGWPTTRDNGRTVALRDCNGMSGGASGGPFAYGYNSGTGDVYQNGTYLGNCGGEACGPWFANTELEAWQGAKGA
ncbi:hypothetical protein [Kibdelosporangium phytohabitans]|uniref:Peptidase n=1 Tax=Kibdelosporangium phytohabitans TaxID=860235 RepID=A0A0N9I0T2_9PSEU|nr:hypothetical protein [Kibdelosporangium phytohabitans]ALG08077.1 hypothetical protein AOZ06_15165 [Kibdelosporangium phytohabitans]MBE1470948.1 hypothetical protein [Kibdelosporangium phytohabitans]